MARITLSISDELRDRLDVEVKRRNDARDEYAPKVSRSLVVCAMIDAALAEDAAKCDEPAGPDDMMQSHSLLDATPETSGYVLKDGQFISRFEAWILSFVTAGAGDAIASRIIVSPTCDSQLLCGLFNVIAWMSTTRQRLVDHHHDYIDSEHGGAESCWLDVFFEFHRWHDDYGALRKTRSVMSAGRPTWQIGAIRKWMREHHQLMFDLRATLIAIDEDQS